MSKINELIQTLCPDGVEYKKLGVTCNMKAGKAVAASDISSEYSTATPYPCYGGNGIRGFVSMCSHSGEFPIIGRQGALCGNINYATGDFYATEHAVVVESRGEYNQKFLKYLLIAMDLNQYKSKGAQPGLAVGNIEKIVAPVPPLPVQEEIVRILDEYTDLEAELEAKLSEEIELKQKQYEVYRDELLTFADGVERKKLGEVATISRGNGLQKKDFVEEGRPCIHYGQIFMHYSKMGIATSDTLTYIDDAKYEKNAKALPNDVVMAVTSENVEDICKCVVWEGDEPVAVSGHTAIFHTEMNSKFLAYWFNTSDFYVQKVRLAHGTKVIEVTPAAMADIILPVPAPTEQERIVKTLDKYDTYTRDMISALNTELESRKKQYAYYRDQLLTFKRKEV